jgi:hypothetical protein
MEVTSDCNQAAIFRVCKNGGDLQQLAKACHVPYKDKDRGWFWKHIDVKYSLCSRLFAIAAKQHGERLYRHADATMKRFLENVVGFSSGQDSHSFYIGDLVDCLFALIYLLESTPASSSFCMILNPLADALAENDAALNFSDFALVWIFNSQTNTYSLEIPGHNIVDYMTKVATCLLKKRFFVSLLVLVPKPRAKQNKHTSSQQGNDVKAGVAHASCLFYDKQTGLLERYDPYGCTCDRYDIQKLDAKLTRMFAALSHFKAFIRPPSMRTVERKGLQWRQENQKEEKKHSDPGGFCVPWTILYISSTIHRAPLFQRRTSTVRR